MISPITGSNAFPYAGLINPNAKLPSGTASLSKASLAALNALAASGGSAAAILLGGGSAGNNPLALLLGGSFTPENSYGKDLQNSLLTSAYSKALTAAYAGAAQKPAAVTPQAPTEQNAATIAYNKALLLDSQALLKTLAANNPITA